MQLSKFPTVFAQGIGCLTFSCRGSDNPIDPQNPETRGKPVRIEAEAHVWKIQVSWSGFEIQEGLSYALYRKDASVNIFRKVYQGEQTWYADINVENGHFYGYRISLVDPQGHETVASDVLSVTK